MIRSASHARRSVRDELAAAGIVSAEAEASRIVAEVCEVEPARLPLAPELTDEQIARIAQITARRVAHEPLQYILGWVGFRRLTLDVGPGVFVPRPETEVLVSTALAALADDELAWMPAELRQPRAIAVDLCAGSGAIALALGDECAGLLVYAVEREPAAFPWLKRNLDKHRDQLAARGSQVIPVLADATADPLPGLQGKVRLVACNPPYIPADCVPRDRSVAEYDPASALYGGTDGLDVVRGVCRTAAALLRPGGVLAMEHGDLQGGGAGANDPGVPGVLRGSGWYGDIRDLPDLAGRPRVTVARRI